MEEGGQGAQQDQEPAGQVVAGRNSNGRKEKEEEVGEAKEID